MSLGIAFELLAVNPSEKGVLLFIAKTRVVRPFAEGGIGFPGRHFAGNYSLLDCRRPRAHVLIGNKRHRGDVVRVMARNAVLIQNRSDVVCKRHFGGCNRKRQTKSKKQPHLHSYLKLYAKPELDNARRLSRQDLAKEGAGSIQIRRIEARVVQYVKELGPKLGADALVKGEVFEG